MKNGKNTIKKALQSAILQGKLPELESKLIKQIFEKDFTPEPEGQSSKLINFLEKVRSQLRKQDLSKKLSDVNNFHTFGEYLKTYAKFNDKNPEEVLYTSGFPKSHVFDLLENRKPVIEFSTISFAKICKELNLSLSFSIRLITVSIDTFNLSPLVQGGMARYSTKKGVEEKNVSMKRGMEELLMKASKSKPLTSYTPSVPRSDIDKFILDFKKAYSAL